MKIELSPKEWWQWRLRHKEYWPPRQKERDLDEPWQTPGPPPKPFTLNEPEGAIIGWGANRDGKSVLMIQFAIDQPFVDHTRSILQKDFGAQWAPRFNLWQVPIKSQKMGPAIRESLIILQEALLFLDWSWPTFLLSIQWNLLEAEKSVFFKFIERFNNQYYCEIPPPTKADFIQEISTDEIESRCKKWANSRGYKSKISDTERVDILRHQCTAYDSLLALNPGQSPEAKRRHYLKVFEDCNRLICNTYPELADEAMKQIQVRKRNA